MSQMSICKEENDASDVDEKSKQSNKEDPNNVDVGASVKKVRRKRFRKKKKHAKGGEIDEEVKRLLRDDLEAFSSNWEVVIEKSARSVPLKQEPTTGSESDDEENMDVDERGIFSKILSKSDEDLWRNFLIENDSYVLTKDNFGNSQTDSSERTLITQFSNELFIDENVTNLKQPLVIKTEPIKLVVVDTSAASRNVGNVKNAAPNYDSKTKGSGIEVDSSRDQQASENIQAKLDALQIEIKRLTVKRQQVEFEIGRIEHLHLKQRFQEISARLLTQRLEIEHQYQDLSASLESM